MPAAVPPPDLRHEQRLVALCGGVIAGMDEAGRGPLAGPVVAACVVLDFAALPEGLADSKALSRARRTQLAGDIRASARAVAVGQASVPEIDQLNILQASFLAMRRALARVSPCPAACLVDGRDVPPDLACPAEAVIGGDAVSASVAAASIIAKVHRDALMARLHRDYPDYGWDSNAGYGVRSHLKALDMVGPSPHHRKSFGPVAKILAQKTCATA
ncbi:MAG: ribonuclease HII [Rhodothalassiaceae bacterium]